MTTPEVKQPAEQQSPQAIIKEQETLKELPSVEEKATTVIPGQIAAQVGSQSAQPASSTPAAPTITITIPASPQQLEDWSKGSPEDSITWFAFYWIRMIKKAFFYGWRVITGGSAQTVTQ